MQMIKIEDVYINPKQVTMVFVEPNYPFMTCIRLACGEIVATEQSFFEILDRLTNEKAL